MPDVSKIGTVETANISKVGTVDYDSSTMSSVLGADVPDGGGGDGGGGDGGGGGGGTAAAGYYPATWDANNALFTADGGTTLKTYDVDFSSSDYANGTIVGEDVEIYFMYVTVAASNGWQGDPQLYRYDLTGTDGSNLRNPYTYGYSDWRDLSSNITIPTNSRYRYQMDSGTYKVSGLSVTSIIGSNNYSGRGHFIRLSSGGTASGSTGVSASGYIYYEATSQGYSNSSLRMQILKHVSFTATSDTIRFQWYNYGSRIGSLNVGIRVL